MTTGIDYDNNIERQDASDVLGGDNWESFLEEKEL